MRVLLLSKKIIKSNRNCINKRAQKGLLKKEIDNFKNYKKYINGKQPTE